VISDALGAGLSAILAVSELSLFPNARPIFQNCRKLTVRKTWFVSNREKQMCAILLQVVNGTFNKGVLMNSGFMEIAKLDKFDCFVFHDVDLLPEDDRIYYTCDRAGIKHLAYALEEWGYQYVAPVLVDTGLLQNQANCVYVHYMV